MDELMNPCRPFTGEGVYQFLGFQRKIGGRDGDVSL